MRPHANDAACADRPGAGGAAVIAPGGSGIGAATAGRLGTAGARSSWSDEASLGARRGGFLDVLVTNELTALRLRELEGTATQR